ncbi:hypothetical protein V8F06_012883 [Rhypophila decipiens]
MRERSYKLLALVSGQEPQQSHPDAVGPTPWSAEGWDRQSGRRLLTRHIKGAGVGCAGYRQDTGTDRFLPRKGPLVYSARKSRQGGVDQPGELLQLPGEPELADCCKGGLPSEANGREKSGEKMMVDPSFNLLTAILHGESARDEGFRKQELSRARKTRSSSKEGVGDVIDSQEWTPVPVTVLSVLDSWESQKRPISAPITPQNPAKLNSRTGKVTRPRPQTSPASIIDLCGGKPERVGVVKIVGLSSGDPGGWRCRIWGVRAPRLVSALADWAEAQQVTCFQVPARKRRGRNLLRAILRPFQPVRAVAFVRHLPGSDGLLEAGTGTVRMRMYEYQTYGVPRKHGQFKVSPLHGITPGCRAPHGINSHSKQACGD